MTKSYRSLLNNKLILLLRLLKLFKVIIIDIIVDLSLNK